MDQYELQRWSLVFRQARSSFGICDGRQKRITISAPLTLLNDIDEVRNTILHEIAHALTTDRGHGRLWKEGAHGGLSTRAVLSQIGAATTTAICGNLSCLRL
jgi:SprT-like family protein